MRVLLTLLISFVSAAMPMFARTGDGVLRRGSFADAGFDSRLGHRIDSIVELNISKRSFPGCQVVVACDGIVVVDKAYGHLDYSITSPDVNRSTLYDIASMTKVAATVSAIMQAVESGTVDIDAPVGRYLPELAGTDKENITIRRLLLHESGLESISLPPLLVDSASFTGRLIGYRKAGPLSIKIGRNVYANRNARLCKDLFSNHRNGKYDLRIASRLYADPRVKTIVDSAIAASKLKTAAYRYSDLGFCLLKNVVEATSGETFDRLLDKQVFAPIGMRNTMFNPLSHGRKDNIAPTERDDFLRRQTVRGYVHDEIAAFSGGVQGNAGLFSTAADMARLCQTWLNGGSYGGKKVFSSELLRMFTADCSPKSHRGLGFDRAARIGSMADAGVPGEAYGHLGFTGTGFWADPVNRIIVVFLSNRVCPSRDNPSFDRLSPRTAIMEAVYDSLLKPSDGH